MSGAPHAGETPGARFDPAAIGTTAAWRLSDELVGEADMESVGRDLVLRLVDDVGRVDPELVFIGSGR